MNVRSENATTWPPVPPDDRMEDLGPLHYGGAGIAIGDGQAGARGLDGAGGVEGHLPQAPGDLVGTEVPDEDVLEAEVVFHHVVEVVGLKGYAEPLGQAVDVVVAGGVGYQQQLAALPHELLH